METVFEKPLNGEIGNLTNLTTTAKTDLVSAVNEVKGNIPAVINNLTSDSTTSALSAAMGKSLNSKTNSKARYLENTSKTDVTLLSEDFANIPANDVTFYRINPIGAYMMGSFIKYNSQSGSGVFTTYAGKIFQISNNSGTWSKEELALNSNITINDLGSKTLSGLQTALETLGASIGNNEYRYIRFYNEANSAPGFVANVAYEGKIYKFTTGRYDVVLTGAGTAGNVITGIYNSGWTWDALASKSERAVIKTSSQIANNSSATIAYPSGFSIDNSCVITAWYVSSGTNVYTGSFTVEQNSSGVKITNNTGASRSFSAVLFIP